MASREDSAPTTIALVPDSGAKRCVVGIAASRGGEQLTAALVSAAGFGASAAPKLIARAALDMPESLRKHRCEPEKAASGSLVPRIGGDVADTTAALVDKLFSKEVTADDVLAVGIDDGVAPLDPNTSTALSCNLFDGARLAELTGQNVIDGFAARDIARGGRGGPLYPLPYWMWFADRRTGGGRTRLLVELGDQTTLLYLPPHRSGPLAPAISMESSPAAEAKETAEYIASIVERRDADKNPISGLILAGAQRSNVSLVRTIASRLPVTLMPLPEFGIDESDLNAACAALLALLHVDQVAANVPEITGARSARVLGRLTPGNPARWRRLLMSMSERNRNVLPLRNAV